MDMREDLKPEQDVFNLGDRISILTEMLISLQARRNDNEISYAVYMNGLQMLERLAGGEKLR